jgi:hypothetical protein
MVPFSVTKMKFDGMSVPLKDKSKGPSRLAAIADGVDPDQTLEVVIDDALTSVFDCDTLDYRRYHLAAKLDTAGLNL